MEKLSDFAIEMDTLADADHDADKLLQKTWSIA